MLFIYAFISIFILSVHAKQLDVRDGTTTNPTCSDDDMKFYTDEDGFTYQLRCSVNGVAGLIAILGYDQPSLATCIKFCSDYNLGRPDDHCDSIRTSSAPTGTNNLYTCFMFSGSPTQLNSDSNYNTAVLVSEPGPLPAIQYTFQAVCPDDNGKFYTDAYGYTYQALCNSALSSSKGVTTTTTANYGDCAHQCSAATLYNGAICSGFQYLSNSCKFTSTITRFIPGSSMIGMLVSAPGPCPVSPTTKNYTLKEGGTYYQSSLQNSDAPFPLMSSYQADLCICVEQCAYYNRENNGTTPPAMPCLGVEFDTSTSAEVNCVLKSH